MRIFSRLGKGIVAGLLSVVLCITFVSCSEKPLEISEEEALVVLKELVPKSYEFNVIFFGEGLPAVEEAYEEEHTSTAYYQVREDCGYHSVDAIKTAAEKVYSERYLSGVYVAAFEGVTAESSDGMLDTSVSPRYQEINGALHVDVSASSVAIKGELTVIAATVTQKTPEYVKLDMTYSENGQEAVMTVFLTLQNGVWLLDGPTY